MACLEPATEATVRVIRSSRAGVKTYDIFIRRQTQGEKDRSNLYPHIVWNYLFFDEAAHEIKICITSSGICNLNLLVAAFDEQLKESSLLLDSHRIR